MTQFQIKIPVLKSDQALRVVYGWASVIEQQGQAHIDRQGDTITSEELVKAAHHFMQESRDSKAMHRGHSIGHVVESIVLTKDVQDSLGIHLDKVGWYIGIKISDDEVWDKIQNGDFRQFSIGGRAKRVETI